MINAPKWESLPTPVTLAWGPIPQPCFSGHVRELTSKKGQADRTVQNFLKLDLTRVNVSSWIIEHHLVPNILFHSGRKRDGGSGVKKIAVIQL